MQIDFHHSVTYVVARLAGFDHHDAHIIAYSAQYVDDATNAGDVKFDNGAMYHRIASAHKMIDYDNFNALKNHQSWIPFHFLPGNGGLEKGENPDGSFIHKIICTPNSPVAKDMLNACMADKNKPYALHRLGITLHVYADTWAHQNFVGVNHKSNRVSQLSLENADMKSYPLLRRIKKLYFKVLHTLLQRFPLGHGPVMDCPDRPYLKWRYVNDDGKAVVRDNCVDFMKAVEHMFDYLCHYKQGLKESRSQPFPKTDHDLIRAQFQNFTQDDGEKRHEKWLASIREGLFSFGSADLNYIPKGEGSWKHESLGTLKALDAKNDTFVYKAQFLTSNWKLFHDALQAHRFDILHDILPLYGICVA